MGQVWRGAGWVRRGEAVSFFILIYCCFSFFFFWFSSFCFSFSFSSFSFFLLIFWDFIYSFFLFFSKYFNFDGSLVVDFGFFGAPLGLPRPWKAFLGSLMSTTVPDPSKMGEMVSIWRFLCPGFIWSILFFISSILSSMLHQILHKEFWGAVNHQGNEKNRSVHSLMRLIRGIGGCLGLMCPIFPRRIKNIRNDIDTSWLNQKKMTTPKKKLYIHI